MGFELGFIKEKRSPQDSATPTLSEVLKEAMEGHTAGIHVALPAEVLKYDKDKQTVDVQPQLKKKYNDGKTAERPAIYNVPVVFPRAGKAFIAMPIKKGHNVLLIFIDRSMDKWKTNGGKVDPDDTRKHHATDAVAIPGLYPFSDPVGIHNDDDIIVKNEGGNFVEFRIKKNGHLQVINKTDELIKVLSDLIQDIREARVYTSTGRQRLRHKNFEKDHKRLKTFLEK